MTQAITKDKRGFTFLEFMVASLIFSILGIAAGSLFYFHGKLIRDTTQLAEQNLKTQIALNHILENVKSSAWIVVKSPNDLELHSHTNPDIREYHLLDNRLTFKAGNVSNIIADNIEADNLFTPVGVEKRNGRFHKVKIEFWTKTRNRLDYHNKDVFYAQAYAASQETWDLLYVDPGHVESIQDGTKIRPFATLQQALDVVAVNDAVIVLSGDHTVTGDINLGALSLLYFAAPTTFNVQGPATLTMGGNDLYQTVFASDGKINLFAGDGSRITITGGEDGWWSMTLTQPQPVSNFQYLNLIRGSLSLESYTTNRADFWDRTPRPFNITFANNILQDAWVNTYSAADAKAYKNTFNNSGLYFSGSSGNEEIYDNTLSSYSYLYTYNYTSAQDATIHTSIHDNTGTGYTSISAYSYSGKPSATLRTEIYNNTIRDGYISVGGSDSGATTQDLIYNNKITRSLRGGQYSQYTFPIYYSAYAYSGDTVNPNSFALIQNNTIDANYTIGGIYVSAYDYSNNTANRRKMYINNNVISRFYLGNSYDWYSTAAISLYGGGFDAEINNNIMTTGYTGVLVSDYSNPVNLSLNNNIISGLYWGALRGYSLTKASTCNWTNNTVVNVPYLMVNEGPTKVNVKNCILWNTTAPSPSANVSLSYSNLPPSSGTALTTGTGNLSVDPAFADPSKQDFSLKTTSLLINAGDPSILDPDRSASDMGAYGGPGAKGWERGSGAQ